MLSRCATSRLNRFDRNNGFVTFAKESTFLSKNKESSLLSISYYMFYLNFCSQINPIPNENQIKYMIDFSKTRIIRKYI